MRGPQLGFTLALRPTAEQLLISLDVEVGMVPPGASHQGITHCLLAAALHAYRSPTSVIICSSGCYSLQPRPFGNVPSKREISTCTSCFGKAILQYKSEFCTVAGDKGRGKKRQSKLQRVYLKNLPVHQSKKFQQQLEEEAEELLRASLA